MKLSKNAEQLLRALIETDKPTEYARRLFDNLKDQDDIRLRSLFKVLKEDRFINIMWSGGLPYFLTINENAYAYFEDNDSLIHSNEMVNIESINLSNGNIVLGNVTTCQKDDKRESKQEFLWEPDPPVKNNEQCKSINEHPKEPDLFGLLDEHGGYLEGVLALALMIHKYTHTERWKYLIYSDDYGNEYMELLTTEDTKTFHRLAPEFADSLINNYLFKEWIRTIYSIRKLNGMVLMDFGVCGNRGKILTINLTWNQKDKTLLI